MGRGWGIDEAGEVLQRAHHAGSILPGAPALDGLDEPHQALRGWLEAMAMCDEGAIIARLEQEVPVRMVADAEMEASIRFEANDFRMRDIADQAHDSLL